MRPDEVAIRLAYLNVSFKGLTTGVSKPGTLTDANLRQMYDSLRDRVEEMSVEEMIDDLQSDVGKWITLLTRHRGRFCRYGPVPVDRLCFDAEHEGAPFHGLQVVRGHLLLDFLTEYGGVASVRGRVDFINGHWAFFRRYLPISVQEYGGLYEVLEGNHRAFSAMEQGESAIPACVEFDHPIEGAWTSLDFPEPEEPSKGSRPRSHTQGQAEVAKPGQRRSP